MRDVAWPVRDQLADRNPSSRCPQLRERRASPRHHSTTSFPTSAPVEISAYSGVIWETSCASVGIFVGRRSSTWPSAAASISSESPSFSLASSTTGLGMRTARLLPHLTIWVFMNGPLLNNTQYSPGYLQCRYSILSPPNAHRTSALRSGISSLDRKSTRLN